MNKIGKILFLFVLIFCFLYSAAQDIQRVTIDRTSKNYSIHNKQIYILSYELTNSGNCNYWFWFDSDCIIGRSTQELVKSHFFKINGDFSLYQLAMDNNIEQFTTDMYTSFVRYIKPQEKFEVQIISAKKVNDCYKNKIFQYFEQHIVIIDENHLTKQITGLNNFNPIIFYKNNWISIPIDILKIDCGYDN